MKDIIIGILIYMIWNSSVHLLYPNLLPAIFTLWILIMIGEFIITFNKNKTT
jgi:hypothetical protein